MALEAVKLIGAYSIKFVPKAVFDAAKYAVAYVVNKVAQMSFTDFVNYVMDIKFCIDVKNWLFGKKTTNPTHPIAFLTAGVALWISTIGLMYSGPTGCKFANSPGLCNGFYYGVITLFSLGGLGLICMSFPENNN